MAKKDFSQLVAHVEQKQEVKEEATNLDEQLRTLWLAVTHIINNTLTLEHEGKDIEELVKALNVAKESVDNAITGICNAIVEAHHTPMKVEMTDEGKQVMEEGRTKMINREEELFQNHETAIGRSIQTLETKFKNVVYGFKGVWIDKKTFNIYYWTFFGMLEITLMSVALLIYYWVKFGAPWNCSVIDFMNKTAPSVRTGLTSYYISHLNCFVNMPFESTAYQIPSFSTKAITVGLIRISWA